MYSIVRIFSSQLSQIVKARQDTWKSHDEIGVQAKVRRKSKGKVKVSWRDWFSGEVRRKISLMTNQSLMNTVRPRHEWPTKRACRHTLAVSRAHVRAAWSRGLTGGCWFSHEDFSTTLGSSPKYISFSQQERFDCGPGSVTRTKHEVARNKGGANLYAQVKIGNIRFSNQIHVPE
jgi:hypothetical protein